MVKKENKTEKKPNPDFSKFKKEKVFCVKCKRPKSYTNPISKCVKCGKRFCYDHIWGVVTKSGVKDYCNSCKPTKGVQN